MKLFLIIAVALVSSLAQAESTVLTCLRDGRASDGPLKKLVITKTSDESFKFVMMSEGSGFSGTYKKEVSVGMSDCEFSNSSKGAGECREVTADGFAGNNRLTTVLAFQRGRELIRAINYKTGEDRRETVSAEISFDLSDCTLTQSGSPSSNENGQEVNQ